jgi:hypothetical protein
MEGRDGVDYLSAQPAVNSLMAVEVLAWFHTMRLRDWPQ